ncbi:hypothetical protein FACS1894125_4520 [Actinomycetota bacterium]|nr:hypothetical protein FACS1894125_4520 [Actinomycetota bacterium]
MGTAVVDMQTSDYEFGGESVCQNSISAADTYTYTQDDWRRLSDEDFHVAILARAKDAQNRPRVSWEEVKNSARLRINERFAND